MKASFRPRLWLVASVPAALLARGAWALPERSTAGLRPVMVIGATSEDCGTVEEGTVAQCRFTVENRGQADLEITEVKPSCGCTVSQWDHTVKPGGRGMIDARMNTEYFRGSVAKHLTVMSNDPNRPQVELTITARVTPLVRIEPGLSALLSVADKPVTQVFTLERSGDRPMKILQVVPNAPFLTADVVSLPGEGRYKLTVTASPAAPLGRSTVPLVVRTDMAKGGMLTLALVVDRGIVTVPPMVFYGLLPEELHGAAQATVTLLRTAPPFHVTSAAVDDPQLNAQVKTVRDGAEYRVTVTYRGGWGIGARRQLLTVSTDDPKQPAIQIPVQAIIQAKVTSARTVQAGADPSILPPP